MIIELEEKLYQCPTDFIIVPDDRIREDFDKKVIEKIAESIKNRRQDQPGVCFLNSEGKPVLVAGGQRLEACKLAQVPYTYRLQTDVDPIVILEIELEENLCRKSLTFMEECKGLAKLQEIKQQIYGESKQGGKTGWGIQKTADLTNRSVGTVHENLELAQFAAAMPEEFQNVKSKKEAKAVVARLVDNARRAVALSNVEEKVEEGEDLNALERQIKKFSSQIICDSMDHALAKDKTLYDIVIFDPPWGVDFDSVSQLPAGQEGYEDPIEKFQQNFPLWLKRIYNSMSENSHLYLFFGIVNHAYVYQELEEAGFETNWMPLIWYKQGAHRTRNPEIWPGRSYEPIAYARKGKKKLVKPGAPDVIITPAPTPSMKQIHPSAKHPMIYLELLQRSAFPADKILDPMAGSGMLGVAAEVLSLTHKLQWKEIEEKQTYCNLALDNVVKGYYQVTQQQENPNAPE